MITMQKGNKQLTVDENMLKKYLADGYDQINDDGTVKQAATGGKEISIAEHTRVVSELKKEIDVLQSQVEKLKKKDKGAETSAE